MASAGAVGDSPQVEKAAGDRGATGRAGLVLAPLLFSLTLLVSSGLLFLVQLIFAQMTLPLLGGTPAVWTTCMVFYQAALLAGYAYAHAAPGWLGTRRHAVLHLVLLTAALLVLPVGVARGWAPPGHANPIPWLLALLLVSVGLPFFAVSTTSPLLQKWFSRTGHPSAHDPYFLYAAGNAGSLLGLAGYPLLAALRFGNVAQSLLWTAGYALLVLLTFGCAVLLWRGPRRVTVPLPTGGEGEAPLAKSRLGARRRLRWVLLAFVPSSLMLSVTTYLTTDVAAVPLLWEAPLGLYLLTFILAFSRRPPLPHRLVVRVMPLFLVPLVVVLLSGATEPAWLLMAVHLLAFFVIALVCHGELARDRPAAEHLTEFYLWLATGGVLGGLFNALLAPLLFYGVAEYPLALVLACLLRPGRVGIEGETQHSGVPATPLARDNVQETSRHRTRAGAVLLDLALPLGLGLLALGLAAGCQAAGIMGKAALALAAGVPAVLCFTLEQWPLRFALGTAAILLAGSFSQGVYGRVLHQERSFFGVLRVTLDPTGSYHQLVHGNTVHGRQSLDPDRRREPLSYYHRTGPIGKVFAALAASGRTPNVAVIGLGAGALAAYGAPGQEFTYYEIDPAVVRIASDPRYFTYLADSQARVNVVLGDARLMLATAPDGHYGLIVIDAFSSDAIPLHLVTREALRLYLSKLAPGGLLAFHISNRYLDLAPVLGDLARDAGVRCLVRDDWESTEDGKDASQWVVMARQQEDFGRLAQSAPWAPAPGRPEADVWTDDFSNPFAVFRWGGGQGGGGN